jgi:hypothetical protein
MRLLAVLLVACSSAAMAAMAAPPMAGGQAPGWFRMKLGNFEVTALNDGIFKLPVDKLLQTPDAGLVIRRLQEAYLGIPVDTSVNTYLIHTGDKLVMIDTGHAGQGGAPTGLMLKHLRDSGYSPEQVDEIYITHFHGDHINGLTDNTGKPVFPNATVRADQRESGFWLGDKLVLWGDLMHVAAVQFKNPEVTIEFDSDPKKAAPQRIAQYKDAAAAGYFVGVTHVSFPGIGKLRADGGGYDWIPVNYSRP